MQYHATPCNTMQYHTSLITTDGAYHCPVGSIWPFLILLSGQAKNLDLEGLWFFYFAGHRLLFLQTWECLSQRKSAMTLGASNLAITRSTHSRQNTKSSQSTSDLPSGRCPVTSELKQKSWSTHCQPWWQSLVEPSVFSLGFPSFHFGTSLVPWRGWWHFWGRNCEFHLYPMS